MKTVTITSQGQITIPAAIRKAWGVKGSEELQVSFNPETKRMTLEKPIDVDDFLQIADQITAKIPKNIKPLRGEAIHELHATERAAELIKRSKGKK